MRRMMLGLAVAAMLAALLAFAGPALAAPGGNGCGVGQVVSGSNHLVGGGIGERAHEGGLQNIGNELIQPFHDEVKDICHA